MEPRCSFETDIFVQVFPVFFLDIAARHSGVTLVYDVALLLACSVGPKCARAFQAPSGFFAQKAVGTPLETRTDIPSFREQCTLPNVASGYVQSLMHPQRSIHLVVQKLWPTSLHKGPNRKYRSKPFAQRVFAVKQCVLASSQAALFKLQLAADSTSNPQRVLALLHLLFHFATQVQQCQVPSWQLNTMSTGH